MAYKIYVAIILLVCSINIAAVEITKIESISTVNPATYKVEQQCLKDLITLVTLSQTPHVTLAFVTSLLVNNGPCVVKTLTSKN